jgi:hypothetical protein
MATPSSFTYGLGNPKATTVTKPGQTLPTTKASKSTGTTLSAAAKNELSQAYKDLNAEFARIDAMTGKDVGGGYVPPTGGGGSSDVSVLAELAKQQAAKDARDLAAAQAQRESQSTSAYALLLSEFSRYGLESLVTPLQDLIKQGLSGPEFQIALRNTDAYQKRFAGNTDRIKKGLTALSPAEYLALEDGYQNLMRNYGLPASYYTKDSLGTQAGFNKLIANDVSAVELEDRIVTAQKRVLDAAPEVTTALKQFYPDITNGDILAYTLNPEK